MAQRLRLTVPAKVNLHLQVLGRRPDGYHELRTLFQSVDLFDELEATGTSGGELVLEVEPPGWVTSDTDNLVLRAARALRERSGITSGARLVLRKRIPVGGGMGGGSADAAAALVLLNRLWRAGLEAVDLFELGAGLGSDVPFFLCGGLALGVGRGDEVYGLRDFPELGVLVCLPAVSVSTATVYESLDKELTWRQVNATVYGFSAGLASEPAWDRMTNDLQAVVVRQWPQIGRLLHRLEQQHPLRAAVTGSGAAVFAVFSGRDEAERAASAIDPAEVVHVGCTLARDRAALLMLKPGGEEWEQPRAGSQYDQRSD